jgi:hypothetical protein
MTSPPPLRRSCEAGKEAAVVFPIVVCRVDGEVLLRVAEVFFCPCRTWAL